MCIRDRGTVLCGRRVCGRVALVGQRGHVRGTWRVGGFLLGGWPRGGCPWEEASGPDRALPGRGPLASRPATPRRKIGATESPSATFDTPKGWLRKARDTPCPSPPGKAERAVRSLSRGRRRRPLRWELCHPDGGPGVTAGARPSETTDQIPGPPETASPGTSGAGPTSTQSPSERRGGLDCGPGAANRALSRKALPGQAAQLLASGSHDPPRAG